MHQALTAAEWQTIADLRDALADPRQHKSPRKAQLRLVLRALSEAQAEPKAEPEEVIRLRHRVEALEMLVVYLMERLGGATSEQAWRTATAPR